MENKQLERYERIEDELEKIKKSGINKISWDRFISIIKESK